MRRKRKYPEFHKITIFIFKIQITNKSDPIFIIFIIFNIFI